MGDIAVVNITAANNEDWSLTFKLTQDGDPMDLTGYSARMQVRVEPLGRVLIDLATGGGGLVIDEDEISINVPASRNRGIRAGAYPFDLLLTIAGTTTRAFVGTLTVEEGVTW